MTALSAALLATIAENPDVEIIDTPDQRGDEILLVIHRYPSLREGITGDASVQAYVIDEKGDSERRVYSADITTDFRTGAWGVNITGSGPWNSVAYARLATQVIGLAANEAARRNAAGVKGA